MLDDASPEVRIRAEAEEETGYRLHDVHKVFEAFMSPGAITERLHFYVAEYEPGMRVSDGWRPRARGRGHRGAGAFGIDEALTMIADGRIIDAKAIMLLQYAALHIFR